MRDISADTGTVRASFTASPPSQPLRLLRHQSICALLRLPQVAHGAECEAADHGVDIAAVFLQCVHCQQRKLRMRLGIVAEEEIDELLLHQVLCG